MAKTTSPSYTPSSDGRAAASNAANSNVPSTPSTPATPSDFGTANVPNVTGAGVPMGTGSPSGNVGSGNSQPVDHPADSNIGDLKAEPVYEREEDRPMKADSYKSVKSGEMIEVRLLHGVPVKHEGEMYYVATSTDEKNLKGYLVKMGAVENTKEVQKVRVSDTIELYNWEAELAHLFDDLEKIKRNALLSFWKAGALFETDKANPKIAATMFDSAYPYRMP